MPAILYDTVTLAHFAAAGRLELLGEVHAGYSEPHWVEEVAREVQAGANLQRSYAVCQPVLDYAWLGDPVSGPLRETLHLQAVMRDGAVGDDHLGESESIAYAMTCDAFFVTDDASAFDLAAHPSRLGRNRVKDSCAILWEATGGGLLTLDELKQFHVDVFDRGRTMRCRCQHWPGGKSFDDNLRNFLRGGI